MTLPLLSYPTRSQNYRVEGFGASGDEQPRAYSTDLLPTGAEVDQLIRAAYCQIFNEQQLIASTKQPFLESQLRSGQLTVREFIRGLLLSESFRRRNYECSNNYRFVEMCIQRVLGRAVHDEREKLAWSVVVATKGIQGFVDDLLNSEEYLSAFGDDEVPYQRRRVIPQRAAGDVSFAHMPRYGADHLAQLESLGNNFSAGRDVDGVVVLPPAGVRKLGAIVTYACAAILAAGVVSIFLSWFGWIHI